MSTPERFHLCHHAAQTPDKPAIIMGYSGEQLTFAELEYRSNQTAHLFRGLGLEKGDTIACMIGNSPRFFEIAWAAQRSGLYYTFISTSLTPDEAGYIIDNCDAKLFIASAALENTAGAILSITNLNGYFCVDGDITSFTGLERARSDFPGTPIADESLGLDVLYSSGTTGRPKGIRTDLPEDVPIDRDHVFRKFVSALGGIDQDTVYLSPAPLYHTAPLRWCMTATSIGASLIVMEQFDAEHFMKLVDKYDVTNTQLVPTMFVKMLKLPREVRNRYDLGSLKRVLHAAAPCPISIKDEMLDWLGPIIHEYYSASEGYGLTWISSEDWLTHRGSVGKAVFGTPHICDDNGNELETGKVGTIYFSGTKPPSYHKDPDKTAQARHPHHADWSTVGDVGRLDKEGYLYLTDRKAFTIISGGVNIYPQEAEDVIIAHPKVADVAVFGVPNEIFGEEVKAVVQTMPDISPTPDLAQELISYCKSKLSHLKCPKSIDFAAELPRHQTGKLYKREMREKYWSKEKALIPS